eukprot:CAMPEP_0185730988 /NCGR_PEP_ID=MMETSP1171-20130828/11511_1 /TAXON_ID=374046 /ORGANISM="Helicotheca tamensis, Strain CCMP826" /LENGTH=374 /DNA_ID=CAMNT_0028400143 /DNA_START=39 /DNA_END=1163 /DNA_ORIENTATION=-
MKFLTGLRLWCIPLILTTTIVSSSDAGFVSPSSSSSSHTNCEEQPSNTATATTCKESSANNNPTTTTTTLSATTTRGGGAETNNINDDLLKTTKADRYGVVHPIETNELIEHSISKFDDVVMNVIKDDVKVGLKKAQKICPDFVNSKEHKLMFLRCESFDVQPAAERYANYWNKRIELFGEQKACLPSLSLDDALKGDEAALNVGFAKLLDGTDDMGRALMWIDPANLDGSKYSHESMTRAMWYIIHAALESETAQQKGIVFLVYIGNDPPMSAFDRPLIKMISESVSYYIPLRAGAIHIFPTPLVFTVLLNIIKFVLGSRLRKMIQVSSGSNEKIMKKLDGLGVDGDLLPIEVGGKFKLDHDKWLMERRNAGK